jgi:hypothetical protein
MLLVDPLAAFFRPDLEGCPPLTLDRTHVEVELLPPLAKIALVRSFTNTSGQRIEAVLTLPPIGRDEVVFRLIVNIGGVEYEAAPQSGKRARRAHDAAVADGRRAILYELLKHDIQMISIAGIEPGDWVEVQIWSVKALGRPQDDKAVLFIPLSARHDAIMSVLLDADALVTTPAQHPASLTVSSAATQVTLCGPGAPYEMTRDTPINIDCAAPIQLEIVPIGDGSLDHSAVHVDQAAGWEVTSGRGTETFRHPANPGGSVASDRRDWIFGVMKTQQGEVRITAPLLTEMIGPNGRALRAVAAAGFVESGTPLEPAAIRGLAHVLSRQMSLAFIGPEGEVSDELPVLRKLALPEMLSPEKTGLPPQPVALEPFDYGPPEPEPGPLLPRGVDDQHTPGARDAGSRVPAWPLLAAGGLLAIFGVFQLIDYPLPYRLLAILAVVALVATALFPRDESPGRRRLPWLLVLAAPWLIALAAGPLADDVTYGGGAPAPAWMIPTQFALLIASAVLPLGLLPYMRGARRFTIALGVFHLVLTAFVTVSGVLLLSGAD